MCSAINLLSLVALWSTTTVVAPQKAALIAVPVFIAQIIYKTITAVYNKGWTPVIYANQFVTVVHVCTLYAMQKDGLLDAYF